MKIEVNISKKYFFGLLLIGLMVVGFVGVYAYNSAGTGGNPAVFGHSVDEMDWSKKVTGNISADGFCIGDSTDKTCISDWGSLEGIGSQWTTLGSDIYYNGGNVGIGKANSSVKLDVNGSVSVSGNLSAGGICIGTDCKSAWSSGSYVAREANCDWVSDSGTDLSVVPTCPNNKFMHASKFKVHDNNVVEGYAYCCDITIVPA
jgi:hypothetical protein